MKSEKKRTLDYNCHFKQRTSTNILPNSAPFRGRVVERSVERSETEGLISPQKKRLCLNAAGIATSALPPRNDNINLSNI